MKQGSVRRGIACMCTAAVGMQGLAYAESQPNVQQAKAEEPKPTPVPFTHERGLPVSKTRTVKLEDGQTFQVTVDRTCTNYFKLLIAGSESATPDTKAIDAKKSAEQEVVKETEKATTAGDEAAMHNQNAAALGLKLSDSNSVLKALTAGNRNIGILPEFKSLSPGIQSLVPKASQAETIKALKKEVSDTQETKAAEEAQAKEAADRQSEAKKKAADAKAKADEKLSCSGSEILKSDVMTYSSKFGAYQILITNIDKTNNSVAVDTDPPTPVGTETPDSGKLFPVTEILVVPKIEWSTVFSGGLAFSSLTNNKYSLHADTAGTSFEVRREKGSEDIVSAGAAAFATVTRSDWNITPRLHWGLSFGIGVNTGSKIEYYTGPSLLAGSFVITAGFNVGTTDVLPSGVHKGDTVTQSNALGTMGSKTGVGAVIAFTFTFRGDDAQKTFDTVIAPAK